jgi:hypothetical protein
MVRWLSSSLYIGFGGEGQIQRRRCGGTDKVAVQMGRRSEDPNGNADGGAQIGANDDAVVHSCCIGAGAGIISDRCRYGDTLILKNLRYGCSYI